MSAYVPSAFVSDHLEDGYCLQCLTSTIAVMIPIPQLRTGSNIITCLDITKGPTYERGNKNNRNCKPFMPVLQNLRTCRYFHPREDRIDQIQNNLKIVITRYL